MKICDACNSIDRCGCGCKYGDLRLARHGFSTTDSYAGAGDKFTSIPFTNFSATVWARRVIPGGDTTDTNSRSYGVGGWLGTGFQAVLASAPLAADIAEVQAGKLFGTTFGGNQPLLNSNDTLRIGWSYIKSTGQYVFRIGGKAVGYIKSNPQSLAPILVV